MGSGSSKPKPTSSSNGTAVRENTPNSHDVDNLPGSSTPPKGLPARRITPSAASDRNGGVARSDSVKDRSEASSTVPPTTQSKDKENKDRPRTSGIRPSSRAVVTRARKSIVRQMEHGMDDEDSVDTILGLDRMKTKNQLKREKTLLKYSIQEVPDNTQEGRFKRAVGKVQASPHTDLPQGELGQLYLGNVQATCPSTEKIVRIFTSSTFTDTRHERDRLMLEGYPKLKAICQSLGYEFQVVDMRWGVRDQAADDHTSGEICLKELRSCQKLSTGPNFVSLLSQKYGYTDFPHKIDAREYEKIQEHVESGEVKLLFQKWYTKDNNAVPPVYVAAPISSELPGYLSSENETKTAAKKIWWAESEKIQAVLEDVAAKIFDEQTARKYIRSITETEVVEGLLEAREPESQCLWLHRTIEQLTDQECNYQLSRYIECEFNNSKEKVQKSRRMLDELKVKVKKKLGPNILDSSVPWDKEKGIDPETNQAHRKYLDTICKQFVSKMEAMIRTAVKQRQLTKDPLFEEIVQHACFCQNKNRNFHGREEVLKQIKTYVLGMSNEPLVLHCPSGSGKTSIMAQAAREAWSWMEQKGTVVVRFIGTTPGSSNLHSLLTSVTMQIRKAYAMSWTVSTDLRTLIDEFQLSLFLPTSAKPLLLVLDSLDALEPSHNARQLQWLPFRLRPNVKVIVSTLPDEQYEALPVIKSCMHTESNIIEVTKLAEDDVSEIIDKWLSNRNRKLTTSQKTIVLEAFKKCPNPLFLKLAFDLAVSWTSFATADQMVLEKTVRGSIVKMFERLETAHGHLLVARALGYLTISKSGLSEIELEDIMSCDEDVLNDVYVYWTPPVRRLPPLLLVRLRSDLSQYLVDRGADNVRVMNWYHRQFLEAAHARYCSDTSLVKTLHSALADFFAGVWADGREKPYTNSKGDKGAADRLVSSQPNKFGDSYNLRKLNNLPYHRCLAGQLDLLKKESLGNFDFILDKIKATSFWQVIDTYTLAKTNHPEDELLRDVDAALRLSQDGLMFDPNQLVPQLLGRLPISPHTQSFHDVLLAADLPFILPDKKILTQPGGQLIHCMAGHKGDITSLDLSLDGKTALTCSDDGTVRLWSVDNGQQVQNYDGLGKVSRAHFCNNDNDILVFMNNLLTVRTTKTGEKIRDISANDDFPSCVCGPRKNQLVVFKERTAQLYDFTDSSHDFTIEIGSDTIEFRHPGFAEGSTNIAVVTTTDQMYFTVLDLRKKQFSSLFRGFDEFYDEAFTYFNDVDEAIQYEIDAMTVSADEKYIIYSNIYTNDIVFLDHVTKQRVKTIKGSPNDYTRGLRCSVDDKFLYMVRGSYVSFLDRKKGTFSEELEHTSDLVAACTRDLRLVVTAAEDSNVRVWDRTKKVQKISQSPGITAHRVRLLILHGNPRYIIGFGFKTRQNDSQFVFVYDIFKNSTVRERQLDSSMLQMEMLNDKELLVLHDVEPKLKVLDIDTLRICREFQGYLPSRKATFHIIESRQEVVCLSHGRHNLKVYDARTGKVSAILKTDQTNKLDGFCVNEKGTVCVAYSEEPVILYVFDLVNRKLRHFFTPKKTCMPDEEISITSDGKFLLVKVESALQNSKSDEDCVYIEVYDTAKKGGRVTELTDKEYHDTYNTGKDEGGLSSSVDTWEMLDNRRVLSAHDDFIVRLFNIQSGTLLQRLTGHRTSVEITYSPDSPYILTYGSWNEENTLRLWDKSDFKPVASYTLDRQVTNLQLSCEGKLILATIGKPAEIVTWTLHHFPRVETLNKGDYPELLQGQDLKGFVDLVSEDDRIIHQPDDPDKDVGNESSDDDDDFM